MFPTLDYSLVRDVIKTVAPDVPDGRCSCAAPHLRQSFHDERRQYSDAPENSGARKDSDNDDLCPSCAGLPAGCGEV